MFYFKNQKIKSSFILAVCFTLFSFYSALDVKFKKHLKSFTIKDGENATLECEVNTGKPVKVEWLHHGEPVIPSDRIEICRDGGKLQLLIKDITVSLILKFAKVFHHFLLSHCRWTKL